MLLYHLFIKANVYDLLSSIYELNIFIRGNDSYLQLTGSL